MYRTLSHRDTMVKRAGLVLTVGFCSLPIITAFSAASKDNDGFKQTADFLKKCFKNPEDKMCTDAAKEAMNLDLMADKIVLSGVDITSAVRESQADPVKFALAEADSLSAALGETPLVEADSLVGSSQSQCDPFFDHALCAVHMNGCNVLAGACGYTTPSCAMFPPTCPAAISACVGFLICMSTVLPRIDDCPTCMCPTPAGILMKTLCGLGIASGPTNCVC